MEASKKEKEVAAYPTVDWSVMTSPARRMQSGETGSFITRARRLMLMALGKHLGGRAIGAHARHTAREGGYFPPPAVRGRQAKN